VPIGRHQPSVVAEQLQLATEMMRVDAGLNTDQARRHVGDPRLDGCVRLLPEYDRATLNETNNPISRRRHK